MNSVSLFPFIFYAIIFPIASIITFYIPGRVILYLLSKHKLSIGVDILLSTIIGVVLWGMQAYLFGYLHLRWMSYVYLLVIIFFELYYRKPVFNFRRNQLLSKIKEHRFVIVIICIGSFLQVFQVFASGLTYSDGMKFFGVNNIDGVMHLAYIQSIIREFPPQEPGAYGSALVNYHYWSDMIIADFVRIWRIPVHHAFFHFFPIFIAVFSGLAAYTVVRVWGWGKSAGYFSLFFLYFAGDLTYLLILILQQKLNFATTAIDNGATQFFNMPTAMAKMIFLTSLVSFEYWLRTKKHVWGLLTILMFVSLVGVKVYFGIFVMFGFLLYAGVRVLVSAIHSHYSSGIRQLPMSIYKESNHYVLLSIVLIILAGLIYLPANKNSGGLLYIPLEWPKVFLGSGILNLEWWFLRMQVYEAAGNYRNIFILNTFAIIISLLAIHGTRVIGLIPSRSMYKKLGWEKLIFFIPGIILFHILGFTTLQESGGLNVFNFFVVCTVVMSLFASVLLADFLKKKSAFRIAIVIVIVLITIPRVIFETYHMTSNYTGQRLDVTTVSLAELEGLDYIKHNTFANAVVESHPENIYDRRTPYISYFVNRTTYVSGERLQLTHNKKNDDRVSEHLHLFQAENTQEFVNRAKELQIEIIYLQKKPEQKLKFTPDNNILEKIYENNEVVIYRLTGR